MERGIPQKPRDDESQSSSSNARSDKSRSSESSKRSVDSEEEREIDRIMQERKLQRYARQELQREQEGLTKEELDRIMAEGDKIASKVDDTKLSKKDLQKLVKELDELFQSNQEQRTIYKTDPTKYMDSESALHAHLHEIQAIAAYPEKLDDFIDVGAIEGLLAVLQHQNIDICQLSVGLLCELTDKDMVETKPEVAKKCLQQLVDNSIWVILLKVCLLADDEKAAKATGSEQLFECQALVKKCLTLLENVLDYDQEKIADKIMHSDNVIDYVLTNLEPQDEPGFDSVMRMTSELVSRIIQSCTPDWRTKFVITLQGMARLLVAIQCWDGAEDDETIINLFDSMAALLLNNKEHAAVFRQLNGYGLMLRVMVKQPKLCNEALKVISFAFQIYGTEEDLASQFFDAETATLLIDELQCLSVIFGLWMSHPESKLRNKESNSLVVNEHCLSIIWNLIRALERSAKISSVSSQEEEEIKSKSKICLERVSFKFLEHNLQKVSKLAAIHELLFQRIQDFDLRQFGSVQAISQLDEHFGFAVLSLTDALLAYLCQSGVCRKLLTDFGFAGDALEKRVSIEMGGPQQQSKMMVSVLELYVTKCDEMQKNLILHLIDHQKKAM